MNITRLGRNDAHGKFVARVNVLGHIATPNGHHNVIGRFAGKRQTDISVSGCFDLPRRLQLKC
jgi:hypothetical protein